MYLSWPTPIRTAFLRSRACFNAEMISLPLPDAPMTAINLTRNGDESKVAHTVTETVFPKQIFTKFYTSPLVGYIFLFLHWQTTFLVRRDHFCYRCHLYKNMLPTFSLLNTPVHLTIVKVNPHLLFTATTLIHSRTAAPVKQGRVSNVMT